MRYFFLLLLFGCVAQSQKQSVNNKKQSVCDSVHASKKLDSSKNIIAEYKLETDHNYINKRGVYKVGRPYIIDNQEFWPQTVQQYHETGIASWYGKTFYNKKTSNGELFMKGDLTAAHRTMPLPSLVEVTNLENGKTVILKVNDRGPFVKAKQRIIDVSEHAAELLGFKNQGTARVSVKLLKTETDAMNYQIAQNNHKHYSKSFYCAEYTDKNKYSLGMSTVRTEFFNYK